MQINDQDIQVRRAKVHIPIITALVAGLVVTLTGACTTATSQETGSALGQIQGAARSPASTDAPAEASGWVVSNPGGAGPLMTRTIVPLSLYYRITVDEYNLVAHALSLAVTGCGDGQLSTTEVINPHGASLEARRAEVRESMARELRNAIGVCKLSPDVETRILQGFDAAYAEFEALNK